MGKLEEALRGLAELELSCPEPEALLNACAAAGLPLLRPRRVDGFTLRLAVYARDLPRLRLLAARSRCEIRVLSVRGGRRAWRLARRRLPLLLMAALMLSLLLASSLFVWEIRPVGAEELSRGELLRELAACGLRAGTFWPTLDADALRDRMLLRDGRLVWLSVNVRGSVAEVRLLPRAPKPESAPQRPADLVAARAGIVRRVSALRGQPLVVPGMAVTPGETLIAGRLDSLALGERLERAQGEVWADTWYCLSAVCPASSGKESLPGASRSRFALVLGGRRINFYQKGGKPIDACDTIVHEYTVGVDGLFRLPVRLVREELRPYRASAAAAEAGEEQGQRLLARLAEQIEGEILSYSLSVGRSGGLTVVTLRAHCRENIAQALELTP